MYRAEKMLQLLYRGSDPDPKILERIKKFLAEKHYKEMYQMLTKTSDNAPINSVSSELETLRLVADVLKKNSTSIKRIDNGNEIDIHEYIDDVQFTDTRGRPPYFGLILIKLQVYS